MLENPGQEELGWVRPALMVPKGLLEGPGKIKPWWWSYRRSWQSPLEPWVRECLSHSSYASCAFPSVWERLMAIGGAARPPKRKDRSRPQNHVRLKQMKRITNLQHWARRMQAKGHAASAQRFNFKLCFWIGKKLTYLSRPLKGRSSNLQQRSITHWHK